MTTPHEFFLDTINRKIDMDGVPKSQPYQCVDLFKYWLNKYYGISGSKSMCPQSGYAKDIWNCFDQLGLGQYFDKVPTNQMVDGDWAIWNSGARSCPQSHVAMFRKDNGNGTGIFLGQNQSGKTYVSQDNIYYSGMLGGLRPKMYHQPIQTGEKVDQILHKGSKVQLEGTYVVKDINVKENTALITIEGKDYWISSTPLREV